MAFGGPAEEVTTTTTTTTTARTRAVPEIRLPYNRWFPFTTRLLNFLIWGFPSSQAWTSDVFQKLCAPMPQSITEPFFFMVGLPLEKCSLSLQHTTFASIIDYFCMGYECQWFSFKATKIRIHLKRLRVPPDPNNTAPRIATSSQLYAGHPGPTAGTSFEL